MFALDLSAELLARAKCRIENQAVFISGDAEALPFRNESFDLVYGCSVLHHLDLEEALREVRRVLRPGGRLVFSEPNLLNPQVFLMFWCKPLKPFFGISPDEMALTRGAVCSVLRRLGFRRFRVQHFDFLHPAIPRFLLPALNPLLTSLERLPLVRVISGSLLIHAEL